MDVSKLNKSQLEMAQKIGQVAISKGVDPSLAIAAAYAENSLINGSDSDKGAIGPMQVMPSNAKAFGYKPEDLRNVDTNIEVGVSLLAEALNRYKGNARAALVEYNANPTVAARYLNSKEDPNVLPQETQTYLQRIHKDRDLLNSGFLEHTEHAPSLPEEEAKPEAVGIQLQQEAEANPPATPSQAIDLKVVNEQGDLTPVAKIGSTAAGAAASYPIANKISTLTQNPSWMTEPATPTPQQALVAEHRAAQAAQHQAQLATQILQGTPPTGPAGARTALDRTYQGTIDEGATGLQRSRGFNLEEQRRAATARAQLEIAQRFGLSPQTISNAPQMTSTAEGVLAPRQAIEEMQAGQAHARALEQARLAEQAAAQHTDELAQRIQALRQQLPGSLGKVGVMVDKLLSPVAGPLAGAATGLSVADAWNRYQHGDRSGAVMSALEAIFSGMAMAPPVTPFTAGVKGAGIVGGLGLSGVRALMPSGKQTPIPNSEVSDLGLPQ